MSCQIPNISIDQAVRSLPDLLQQVARGLSRIELSDAGRDNACILISKAELECLERALEIFAEMPEMKQVAADIAQIARSTNDQLRNAIPDERYQSTSGLMNIG